MTLQVKMPKMGATMEKGTIVTWLVNKGEKVEEGEPLAEIETDKMILEIESEASGILLEKLFDEGTEVNVHEVIAYIGEMQEEVEVIEHKSTSSPNSESAVAVNLVREEKSEYLDEYDVEKMNFSRKVRRTPAAKKLAEVSGINIHDVRGTGPLGRIQKNDVENYIKENMKKTTPLAKKIADTQNLDYSKIEGTGANGKIIKEDVFNNESKLLNENTVKDLESDRKVMTGVRKVNSGTYGAKCIYITARYNVV
ncbi:E3 binding domain-containing protein [Oceanobacillus senegalensis]|uniref:E3 binding domain-containing protein n=1 Tax=Oceanobacillus senegalensis TaxID=1936063 RepID=UPI001FE9E2C2|nr:E3 binding domain-containing protein [Oceanobacillus senegalensis]